MQPWNTLGPIKATSTVPRGNLAGINPSGHVHTRWLAGMEELEVESAQETTAELMTSWQL